MATIKLSKRSKTKNKKFEGKNEFKLHQNLFLLLLIKIVTTKMRDF